MTTKLTLSIDEEIVKEAKRIAEAKGKSVSKIVEEYISFLPEKEPQKTVSIREISSMLKEGSNFLNDIDYKDFIRQHRYQDQQEKAKTSKD